MHFPAWLGLRNKYENVNRKYQFGSDWPKCRESIIRYLYFSVNVGKFGTVRQQVPRLKTYREVEVQIHSFLTLGTRSNEP